MHRCYGKVKKRYLQKECFAKLVLQSLCRVVRWKKAKTVVLMNVPHYLSGKQGAWSTVLVRGSVVEVICWGRFSLPWLQGADLSLPDTSLLSQGCQSSWSEHDMKQQPEDRGCIPLEGSGSPPRGCTAAFFSPIFLIAVHFSLIPFLPITGVSCSVDHSLFLSVLQVL